MRAGHDYVPPIRLLTVVHNLTVKADRKQPLRSRTNSAVPLYLTAKTYHVTEFGKSA